jgi:predicted esterase
MLKERCMSWMQFPHGLQLDPIAEGSPEALVVLLHDLGASATELTSIAARWAPTVPTTAFTALDGIDPLTCGLPPTVISDLDADTEPAVLDRATRHLAPLLEHQLRSCRLATSRLVLVGFGYGGTLALHLLLREGWGCAGVLAFAAKLTRPLPRFLEADYKVRLIECMGDGHVDQSSLRDIVTLLTARGIDTRGISLAGSVFSDEAIRHGAAYLVELVATAQRRDRFHIDEENGHAR